MAPARYWLHLTSTRTLKRTCNLNGRVPIDIVKHSNASNLCHNLCGPSRPSVELSWFQVIHDQKSFAINIMSMIGVQASFSQIEESYLRSVQLSPLKPS